MNSNSLVVEKPIESIAINTKAPLFHLTDIFGRRINLAEYAGKKVFIGFFRHAGCPFCNLRVHGLMRIQEELRTYNMEMIFFFESPEKLLLMSTFHKSVSPIPIIADPQRVWYGIYGIEQSPAKSAYSHLTQFITTAIKAKWNSLPVYAMKQGESISTMPAEFLLDEDLVIRYMHYAPNLNSRITFDTLFRFAGDKIKASF